MKRVENIWPKNTGKGRIKGEKLRTKDNNFD